MISAWRASMIALLAVAVGAVLWSGCGDDDNNGNPPGNPSSTSFTGFFANGTENGSMNVTVNSVNLSARRPVAFPGAAGPLAPRGSSGTVTASGTLRLLAGGTVSLSGTYNDVSDTLNLANVGAGYAFAGEYDTSGTFTTINGQYTGPNGPGFFGVVTGLTGTTTFCGSYVSGSTAAHGNWDILVAGGLVGGVAIPTAGEPFAFEGTIETTGTTRDIFAGFSDPGVSTLTVTGTLDTTTNTITGSWTYDDLVTPATDSGTWSGSLCPQ